MLKGHTDIYLKDAKTGEVIEERHEDNLVTNAAQEVISMNPFGARVAITGQLPLATKVLGGVLLFPETITESASDYFVHNQWPTGYANTESDPNGEERRGNFNPNESYETSNGYRLVWDFGTADANGEISCVCLTHTNGGNGFESSKYHMQNFTSVYADSAYLKLYDSSNNNVLPSAYHNGAFYLARFTDGSYVVNSLTLTKWDAPPLRQPLGRALEIRSPETIYVDLTGLHIGSSGNRRVTWDSSGLRIVTDNYNNQGRDTYYVTTIAWDGTTSEIAIPKGDMTDILSFGTSSTQAQVTSYAYGNWCYLQYRHQENSTYTHGFYAIDLTNTENINELESQLSDFESSVMGNGHGMVCTTSIPYGWNLDSSMSTRKIWVHAFADGELIYEDVYTYTGNTFPMSERYIYGHVGPYCFSADSSYENKYTYLLRDNTYLATINNLATPITKTADRTLKIVYTLTEAS